MPNGKRRHPFLFATWSDTDLSSRRRDAWYCGPAGIFAGASAGTSPITRSSPRRPPSGWSTCRSCLLVSTSRPSIGHPIPRHEILLGNALVIVENLTNLDKIPSDLFELSAAPLAIVGGDGSPVRAFARYLADLSS